MFIQKFICVYICSLMVLSHIFNDFKSHYFSSVQLISTNVIQSYIPFKRCYSFVIG